MIKAVVFDLDGVLIDSRAAMKVSWNKIKGKYFLHQTFDDYFEHIGLPFLEIMNRIGVKEKVLSIKKDYFRFTQENIELVTQYPGSKEIFHLLRSEGLCTGIITSKEKENTLSICDKFGFTADILITPSDVKNGKPSADSGKLYLEKTGFSSRDVIYVGDMESDYTFSKNTSFKFVYASYGYGYIQSGTCDRIKEISEVLHYLRM
jgi:sugar-phosphatase